MLEKPVFCTVPDELISRSELLQMLGLSENSRYSHFDRLSNQEGFPAPVAAGGGRGREKAWKREDIEQWLALQEGDRFIANGIEYLRDVEVCTQIQISRWTLYKWVQSGKFPAPVEEIGLRKEKAWKLEDVERWLSAKPEDRIISDGIEYLSDVEVCRQIQRSRWTLYKWVTNGKLPQPDFKLRQKNVRRYWAIGTLQECGLGVE